ncbi:MAG: hypothetical protein VKO65_04240 [Cyanobacteriota bacterium]|nr:hypothetical protein [Cyanobacteriota bacterium]
MDPHDLAARTSRWGLALGEITAGIREIHSTLAELGISDPDGTATLEALRLTTLRAQPPAEVVMQEPDDDDGELVIVSR